MEKGDTKGQPYKTSETFKLKGTIDNKSDENFPHVVEEEQTTTENMPTG